jgi:hypothetical protein
LPWPSQRRLPPPSASSVQDQAMRDTSHQANTRSRPRIPRQICSQQLKESP